MEHQERSYSPAKLTVSSDVYPRGFYGTLPEQQSYHDTTRGAAAGPPGSANYQFGSGMTSSAVPPRQSYQIPSASVHPHSLAPSGSFHQQSAQIASLHSSPQSGVPFPAAAMPATIPPQSVGLNVPPLATHASQAHIAQMFGVSATVSEPQMSHAMQQQHQFQRLKVEDALSYLDQVKLQFSGQPQVYNDFLDIMKEFKSQSIDTPGVIKRVSSLFRGHPDLIVGFNTFLPPGYKIAVETNETISVEQPGQQAISLPIYPTSLPLQMPLKSAHLNNPPVSEPLPAPQPIQPASGTGLQSASTSTSSSGQPVEFNHAIQYVNKIKVCYQNKPEIYKSFLDILHKYQKEQKMLKEGTPFPPGYCPLSEVEVYALVTDLFKDQPQLLSEFSQFLPDASGIAAESALQRMRNDFIPIPAKSLASEKPSRAPHQGRKQLSSTTAHSSSQPPLKKAKMTSKEMASQDGDHTGIAGDLSMFERVRDELDEHEYVNMMRCIELYTKQMTTAENLLKMVDPYMTKIPDLRQLILEFLKQRDESSAVDGIASFLQNLPDGSAWKSFYMVDLSTCKEETVSYRLLPKSYNHAVCSGRSELCSEVLNDSYAIHASWPEDISSLGPHKKNQYEEHMYQCEDERYELDMVLELNSMAKTALMGVMARIKNITNPDDITRFRLDDSLGTGSAILMRTALSRLYGEKTSGIIEGLKCNPAAAVPVVLRRLAAKDKEWRTAQHGFNRLWREQNERYYLKSLDHQAAKFKQNDVKQIRSKSLLKDVETDPDDCQKTNGTDSPGRLRTKVCNDISILTDAASLVMHHIRRQSSFQPEDKSNVRHVLYSFVPDLLSVSLPLPPDIDQETEEDGVTKNETTESGNTAANVLHPVLTNGADHQELPEGKENVTVPEKLNHNADSNKDRVGAVYFCNDNWYYFLRLYLLLCDRLGYFSRVAAQLAQVEMHYRSLRSAAVAAALKLRNPNAIDVHDSYSYFLELIRGLLDGNLELSNFEDQLRDIFGIHAYVAFTIDKLIQNITRQLQYIATKDICWKLLTLYENKVKNGRSDTSGYEKDAEQTIADDRYFRVSINVEKTEMVFEYVEVQASSSSDEPEQEQEQLLPEPTVAEEPGVVDAVSPSPSKASFLSRNVRRIQAARQKQKLDSDQASSEVPSCIQLLNDSGSGGACLYTCGAVTSAKQKHRAVSCRLVAKFSRFQSTWKEDNVTEAMTNDFSDWLLGRVDDLKPDLETVAKVTDEQDCAPYHAITKYSVVPRTSSETEPATDAADCENSEQTV